jgi:surfactin synthase thioesterase subunit
VTRTTLDDLWIRRFHPGPDGSTTLICFPHAGGSASYYSAMSALLSPSFQVVAVQYPGRQDRLRERFLTTIDELADGVVAALEPALEQPIAFFGHSMGAMIAFEVATRMKARLDLAPAALFVSGRRAPSLYRVEDDIHLRDEASLVRELKGLSGTDARIFDDPDVLKMVLPSMRNDYRAVETYRWRPGPILDCRVVALIGTEDPKATVEETRAWGDHTTGEFDLHVFEGGHFYLTEHRREVADVIIRTLAD